ncbi:hypothetical protein FRB93_000774 [Tulasnella sp. JGI-2019a]|nr:hypothetical protein FRB93_000774 [Tulasnella sp. JGI-2019a]
MDADRHHDLLPKVKGLFRLLDLHSEQGSLGLVDKIIIAQDSLKSLIDTLSPGAYISIRKINFAALDNVSIKTVGLYGSKSEIVRLLRKAGAVENKTANLLLLSSGDRKASQLSLRSGIYLFLPPAGMPDLYRSISSTVYIIYWPEDTTWDDTAGASVRRNRVTFMRYLIRLTDQIRILASPDHAASLIWREGDSDSDFEEDPKATDEIDSGDERDDRIHMFEVAKAPDQDEDARVYEGFIFKHSRIGPLTHLPDSPSGMDASETGPSILVAGETRPGFMTTVIIPGNDHRQEINETFHQSVARYRIYPLELAESDNATLRDNPLYVPCPRARSEPIEFTLPKDHQIRHVQLLRDSHYLVIADSPGDIRIWLQSEVRPFSSTPTKQLRLPHQYVMAVDESKRLVSFVCIENGRCTLNVFVMDEGFCSLNSRGAPLDVTRWYTDGAPQIQQAVFFPGTEELCIIERSGRARIYSLLSQGFRAASIQLPVPFELVHSAPDASALLVVEGTVEGSKQIRLFHRASFGNRKNPHGIVRDLPAHFAPGTNFAVTSLGKQNTTLLVLLPKVPGICSVAVEISPKETGYQFREQEEHDQSFKRVVAKHNSLLNCFSEVWECYPVIPAIQRETLSADGRLDASVTFVTDYPTGQFARYFKGMVREFKKLSRKPTDQRLDDIQLKSLLFHDVDWDGGSGSVFRVGEWLVELLCLIPIQIGVTRENGFVPLKDGVFDPWLEQQLLGAEMSKIIDTLSLGWYESIFGWYLAAKEVKVISSMGEQGVGKSYSLDHIVDSSFTGCAARATEGVWLSACPTKDTLVVALDFEGIHSIECMTQEDMLLVHFNTALSNLILFRNNLASSRDVANMFTSFQASAYNLNPESNPELFKGRLALVINDVTDSNEKEIVQELKTKFMQIVERDQANNFITKLHGGQLTVIPWNVIGSPEFYTLFSKISKLLFNQKTTHSSAREFLVTLKTVMAILKAQDWSTVDVAETLMKHRCTLLSACLRTALATGYAEVNPVIEELKNLESQEVIPRRTLQRCSTSASHHRNVKMAFAGYWSLGTQIPPATT